MTHPFVAFTNVAKVEMVFLLFDQYIENVHWFKRDAGSFSIGDMTLLASAMRSWWDTNIKANVSLDLSLAKIRVRNMTNDTAPGIEYTSGLPLDGTGAGSAAPGNVTVAIKWTTGFTGRSYRGRTFLCGIQTGSITSNEISNGLRTALTNGYTELIDNPPTGWTLVVASQYQNGAWLTDGIATEITGCSVDPYVDSQRRRLTGRGR